MFHKKAPPKSNQRSGRKTGTNTSGTGGGNIKTLPKLGRTPDPYSLETLEEELVEILMEGA